MWGSGEAVDRELGGFEVEDPVVDGTGPLEAIVVEMTSNFRLVYYIHCLPMVRNRVV